MDRTIAPSEQEIVAGLGARLLKDRKRWLRPAAASGSRAVFGALAALYPTKNDIRDDVLASMKELNARSDGAFAEEFSAAMQAEYPRLAPIAASTQARFLLDVLWYAVRAPRGMQAFVIWARGVGEAKELSIGDALNEEIVTIADLALAAGGDAAALGRSIEAWKTDKLIEGDELVAICGQLRSDAMWEPLQSVLREQPDRADWLILASAYDGYATALKRTRDETIDARYETLARHDIDA